MFKKFIFIISFISSIVFLFIGCGNQNYNDIVKLNTPKNNNLFIKGIWEIEDFKVLEKNLYSKNKDFNFVGKKIYIDNENLYFENKNYEDISYKLKIVNKDYEISYETDITVGDLDNTKDNIEVVTVSQKNNILLEFFRIDNTSGYIYCRGVLFKIKKVGKIEKNKPYIKEEENISDNNKEKSENKGLLLVLKTPRKDVGNGKYLDEEYETVWVSYRNGKVNIEKAKGILFPRMSGLWVLNKKVLEEDGVRKEYFTANRFNKEKDKEYFIKDNKSIYRNINFISNDYILTEEYNGNKFENKFSYYNVLPVDNLDLEEGIKINDIYNKQIKKIYEDEFNKNIEEIKKEKLKDFSKIIDYGNFTIKREKGKWKLVGRISSINENEKPYDYFLNIKPNDKLINFDTLSIPWRELRGEIPFIKDLYTSPDNKIAVILIPNEILVYNIVDKINLEEKPIFRFNIDKNKEVIMADWCGKDYVDFWENTFREFKKNK